MEARAPRNRPSETSRSIRSKASSTRLWMRLRSPRGCLSFPRCFIKAAPETRSSAFPEPPRSRTGAGEYRARRPQTLPGGIGNLALFSLFLCSHIYGNPCFLLRPPKDHASALLWLLVVLNGSGTPSRERCKRQKDRGEPTVSNRCTLAAGRQPPHYLCALRIRRRAQ